MPPTPEPVKRPGRWEVPFGPMTDADIDRVLTVKPFKDMNPDAFPARTPLRDIIRFDARIQRYKKNDIVVRKDDYGTSAFIVLQGEVRVAKRELPASMIGRADTSRKSIFQILNQLWGNSPIPERFRRAALKKDKSLEARRGEGDEYRIALDGVPDLSGADASEVMGFERIFGEMAALTRMPRSRTIFAETDETELLEIRWQGIRELKKYDRALDRRLEDIYRENALKVYFDTSPIFKQLSPEIKQQLRAKTMFATHGRFDWTGDYKRMIEKGKLSEGADEVVIAQEGDYPNGVVIIRAGFARVSRKFGNGERTWKYLGKDGYHGFEEIVHNWRNPKSPVTLQYTLRAIGYTHVLILPTVVMEELVLPNLPKNLLPKLEVGPAKAKETPVKNGNGSSHIEEDTLEFLAEHRFFNGTATMLIDLDRCTRCDDCVRACSATHDNNPRFLRHGPIQGKIMVANACMHCADPVCMIGCPTGAIHRDEFAGEVVINPSTCVGCETCAINCPYDAIRMVEIHDENGELITDAEMRPITKATKCDLCYDQVGGPACQRACPHDALVRMNMNDLDKFAQWLKR